MVKKLLKNLGMRFWYCLGSYLSEHIDCLQRSDGTILRHYISQWSRLVVWDMEMWLLSPPWEEHYIMIYALIGVPMYVFPSSIIIMVDSSNSKKNQLRNLGHWKYVVTSIMNRDGKYLFLKQDTGELCPECPGEFTMEKYLSRSEWGFWRNGSGCGHPWKRRIVAFLSRDSSIR